MRRIGYAWIALCVSAPSEESGTMRYRVFLLALFAAGFLLSFCPQQRLLAAAPPPAPQPTPEGPRLRCRLEESRLPANFHHALSADGRFFAMALAGPALPKQDHHVRVWDLAT